MILTVVQPSLVGTKDVCGCPVLLEDTGQNQALLGPIRRPR